MRRGNDNAFVFGDDGTLAGVSLGADFTAEHEHGIKGGSMGRQSPGTAMRSQSGLPGWGRPRLFRG
jgi:hypothetical protein